MNLCLFFSYKKAMTQLHTIKALKNHERTSESAAYWMWRFPCSTRGNCDLNQSHVDL